MKFIAKTFHGLESVLAEEIKSLGISEVEPLTRAVGFAGELTDLYKANLHLRTALRILMPIFQFNAVTENKLYDAVYDFDWFPYLKLNQTFAIDTTVNSQHFRHSKYVALKTKDAIVDQFRKRTGRRPSVDTQNPDIRLQVHVRDRHFTISMDSSGDPLFKRGYRTRSHPAPLNEVLAAGMIKLSGWTPEQVLVDPMCGSGTILIEAALQARNIPSALGRRKFGFQEWANYDREIWSHQLAAARDGINREEVQIFGSDNSQRSLDICQESLHKLRLEKAVKLLRKDFRKYIPPAEEGILITNPPYGERIETNDIDLLYQEIGDHLKNEWTGWNAWIISSNRDALKRVGLRPTKKHTLFNGPLECKFQRFDLYKGSKKEKSQTT